MVCASLRDLEAGVFLAEFFECGADFLLVASCGGLQRQSEHRLRGGGQFEFARDSAIVNEVADFKVLNFAQGYDVAGEACVDFLGFAALRFEDVAGANAFLLVVAKHIGVGFERAAEDADGGEFHIRAGVECDAENEACQRGCGVGFKVGLFIAVF